MNTASDRSRPRLLVVAEIGALGKSTGFATVTQELLARLAPSWEIVVLGIGYTGEPHRLPYDIHPAAGADPRDLFGVYRLPELIAERRPGVVLIYQDSWNVAQYLDVLKRSKVARTCPPLVAYCPVDAPNQRFAGALNALNHVITPTQFGADELQRSGYTGTFSVIPHGIDTSLFTPIDKHVARQAMRFPNDLQDAFIVGRADRNQPRKGYDLTIEYFAAWWTRAGKPEDAYLYCHCAAADSGWDLPQLAEFYGISNRLIMTGRHLQPATLIPRAALPNVYNAWDVHLSTTLAEGFGLVCAESATCGIPQVLPDYAALGDLFEGAAHLVPCTASTAIAGQVNTIGGVVDRDGVIDALDRMYRDAEYRQQTGDAGRTRMLEPRFRWEAVAAEFDRVLRPFAERKAA